jgi:hypothetical protein
MNENDLKEASVDEIVAAYARAAAAHGSENAQGNVQAANEAYALVDVFSKELRRRGLEAQKALLPLLKSHDPEIRLCAAKDALGFAPDSAEKELQKLIDAKFDCSIHAYLVLNSWKKGKLPSY